ncbi:MAG: hypothetical protein OEY94_01890 [Alphaproteobacteria bacterium]|nr:hypothetical protein [Alphaproteobacteria bacterium]
MTDQTNPFKTPEDRERYGQWLKGAYDAARLYDGSEAAYERVFEPLVEMDKFIMGMNNGLKSQDLEENFANAALPYKVLLPENLTISNILNEVTSYYDRLQNAELDDVLEQLRKGGALVIPSAKTFVQTGEGKIQPPSGGGQSFKIETQPRLAMLIKHLQEMDTKTHTNNLIIRPCTVDPRMVRQLPYVLVQIPHLDKEIAVCDQVGETTFVGQRIIGPVLWESLSKDQLKARPDITAIKFNNEDYWWSEIKAILEGAEIKPKVKNLAAFARKKPPLDRQLIKLSLLAHRLATGKWLSRHTKGPDGKKGSYILKYGPYAEQITVNALNSALRQRIRGLPGGSSISKLNREISDEHGLDYKNIHDQDDLDLLLIKLSLLAHRLATGTWLHSTTKGPDGKKGSYTLKYGPYAEQITVGALDSALRQRIRGLPGGLSISILNKEISDEHGLDYKNIHDQDDLDFLLIKLSLLAHYRATGTWLYSTTKAPNGKRGSYVLEYGPYAGQITVANLDNTLTNSGRGLPGGSSIRKLTKEIREELAELGETLTQSPPSRSESKLPVLDV